jgi:hypothetical protein
MKTETLSEQDGNVFFVCVCRVLLGPPPKREKKGPQNIKYLTVYTWRVERKGGEKPTTAGIEDERKRFFNRRSCSTAGVLLLLLFADEIFTDSSFLIFISPAFFQMERGDPPSHHQMYNSRSFCQLWLDSICWADFFFFDCVS